MSQGRNWNKRKFTGRIHDAPLQTFFELLIGGLHDAADLFPQILNLFLPIQQGSEVTKCPFKTRIIPSPRNPGGVVNKTQRAQRFD